MGQAQGSSASSQMGRLADHGSHLWAQGPCARGRLRVDGFGEDDDGHRAVTSVGRTRRVFETRGI